jgi:hypothetical protein
MRVMGKLRGLDSHKSRRQVANMPPTALGLYVILKELETIPDRPWPGSLADGKAHVVVRSARVTLAIDSNRNINQDFDIEND